MLIQYTRVRRNQREMEQIDLKIKELFESVSLDLLNFCKYGSEDHILGTPSTALVRWRGGHLTVDE